MVSTKMSSREICGVAVVLSCQRVALPIGDLRLGWFLHRHVVFLDKNICFTLSVFTQVYKWIPTTYCGGNPVSETREGGGGLASSNTPTTETTT